jgi:hypothetical protein
MLLAGQLRGARILTSVHGIYFAAMRLNEKGRYFELPVAGLRIRKITYDGSIKLGFDDPEMSTLDIQSEFIADFWGKQVLLQAGHRDALLFFFDYFGLAVVSALAAKNGVLTVKLDNGVGFEIPDGPYENWHYTKIHAQQPKNSLHVHGGIGRIVF